ncbi:MAG: 4'-phosphopantetheinyl transferase [Saprospiraceae bacterium]|jgi:4'-phosphopantetheinyl transferase
MPLLSHESIMPVGELGIWEITETEDFFIKKLNLFPTEEEYIATLKGHRKLEWLAGRYLLHYMSGRVIRGACIKDEFGKPFLKDSPYQISISHSRELASIIAAPFSIGIDIQKRVGKIGRIAHKFMRDNEMESLEEETRLEHLHVYWGAKEALYKAYGRRQLDFKEHIHIEPFSYDLDNGFCSGQVLKGDFKARYQIWYERRGDFILVWAIEE